MTPPRLNELECPSCHQISWFIDADYRGIDGIMTPYGERSYRCAQCDRNGTGWILKRQSPPEFLLQPHPMYPMSWADTAYWLGVLKTHFPDHPFLSTYWAREVQAWGSSWLQRWLRRWRRGAARGN